MKCPFCRNDMIDKSYMDYSIGDWDMDYPATRFISYKCKTCHIKFDYGIWSIPKRLTIEATDKQLKTLALIANNTSFDYLKDSAIDAYNEDEYPVLKAPVTKFIGEHLNEAIENLNKKKRRRNSLGWDYYDDFTYYPDEEF